MSRLLPDGLQRRPGARGGLAAALADYRRYEAAIDRLHQRHLGGRARFALTQDGVSLSSLALHRGSVARMLARSVASGEYRVGDATLREIRVSGKRRLVFMYQPFDLVVQSVVARILSEALEPALSERLFSYRSGLGWADAVADLAAFVRIHRRQRPDPRSRGLYVLRRDVDSYTDSIPLTPQRPCGRCSASSRAASEAAMAPERRSARTSGPAEPGGAADDQRRRRRSGVSAAGVPTGQPIATVVFNLYLRQVETDVASEAGGWYARYSDDLLFAHPDASVAREVSARLDDHLARLRLRFGDRKRRDLYLTGAGRPSVPWPEARGTTRVPFLGMRVDMEGRVAIGDAKVRALLREARRRARNVARGLDDASLEIRGRAVTKALVQLLMWRTTSSRLAPCRSWPSS